MSLEALYHDTNRRLEETQARLGEIANVPSGLNQQAKKEFQSKIELILR